MCIRDSDDIDHLRTFYSCLYRSVLFPRSFYEIDAKGNVMHYSPYNGCLLYTSLLLGVSTTTWAVGNLGKANQKKHVYTNEDVWAAYEGFNNTLLDSLSLIHIFKERRENILLKREHSIPSFLGYNTSAPYGNIGIIENKGFDGTIEYNLSLIHI